MSSARRRGAADLHLHVPQYSAMAEANGNAALRTPSIASSSSYTHRPLVARTMSTTSMLSSDGEGAVEQPWTQAQDLLLSNIYDMELTTYSHANPPFVPSAPPPALLSRVSKRAIKSAGGAAAWPHTLPQTRKHLLILARRNAPEPPSPHLAPDAPMTNPMGVLTNEQPGFFSQRYRQLDRQQQHHVDEEMLNSPFDERTFDFTAQPGHRGSPKSPRKSSERIRNNQAAAAASSAFLAAHEQTKAHSRPDLMRVGSFGFGVPLTPRKGERRTSQDSMIDGGAIPTRTIAQPTLKHGRQEETVPLYRRREQQMHGPGPLQPSSSLDEMGEGSAQGMDKRVAEMMLSPRRSSRLRSSQPMKRTNSSLSITD
ncbi:hypothetical protein BCR37DRAFT_378289 [Protomyces lactucae-debilis]|uniref:Uncharacterized protein n=1 Tax=Protomyces lactucae-debilis TaxID=2754530 RepID=A0A1Y2FNJ0_PROLT|nr:uncharacterized protein BCR37DRAFT_378289 [Protomyces lactucae-debilis]ORY84285.1 hypothetical protein BCR37DRAFT_378289 [Protomyces lactucae-debilis]